MVRSGIAMIELVIAIVVMAIALISVPLITSQTNKSIELSHQYDPIFLAKKQLRIIMSLPWDENDRGSVLTTIENDPPCRADGYRDGHQRYDNRRKCDTQGASALGIDGGETIYDDMDDFDGYHQTYFTSANRAQSGYSLLQNSVDVQFRYITYNCNVPAQRVACTITNAPIATTTNLKLIQTNAYSIGSDINVTLYSISANIGDYLLGHEYK